VLETLSPSKGSGASKCREHTTALAQMSQLYSAGQILGGTHSTGPPNA
jgi:hypothetical protein